MTAAGFAELVKAQVMVIQARFQLLYLKAQGCVFIAQVLQALAKLALGG